jgi:hypothetical protein
MSEMSWIELGQIAELLTGYPFRAGLPAVPDGDLAVVQLHHVAEPGRPLPKSVIRVSNQGGRYDRYLLKINDILFHARGLRHPAGVINPLEPAISAPGLYVIRPDPERVIPQYLAWCINHPQLQSAIAAVAQGTHAPFVSKKAMAAIRVPLPRHGTQRDVVQIQELRETERWTAERLSRAQDSLVHSATWRTAIGEVF